MFLQIENPDGLDLDKFVGWLCKVLSTIPSKGIGREEALEELWNKYFEENDYGWNTDDEGNPVPPSVNYIINQYFDNLVIARQTDDSSYVITTNPNMLLYGTNIRIDTLATMINEGTLTVPPYPYFDNLFEVIANSLQEYYELWLDGYSYTDVFGA